MSFSKLTPEQHRAICSKGGKAAHAQGKAHKWTREQASAAGRKGGHVHAEKMRERAITLTEES